MTKTNSLKLAPYGEGNLWQDGKVVKVRHLLEYTYGKTGAQTEMDWGRGPIEWLPNEPFEATLRIDRLERGRSAARFWFVDVNTGTHYPFFGQGLVEMLSKVLVDAGVVTAKWIVVKRGANYGIELYEE